MSVNIRTDNPFNLGFIINYDEGDKSLERFQLDYIPSEKDKLHTLKDYDTLWDIAFDYYGNSKLWWVIADVNRIEFPFELPTNENIIIPDIAQINASTP